MTRSSQTEYERVAGVLEACAGAEKRLGGHPYRAEIMRRSAELLRRAGVLLRTPAEARQVLALDAIRDVLGIDYDEDSAMWYLPAEPAPIECATLDDALRAYAKMAAPASGERDADALSAVHRTLAFFRSVIQSGESWSETCQREYDMAMGVLDAAMAADTQAEGDDAE